MDELDTAAGVAARRAAAAVPLIELSDADPAQVRAKVLDYLARRRAAAAQAFDAAHAAPPPKRRPRRASRIAFERSPAWRALSAEVRAAQPWCSSCGSTEKLQADHILPKSRHPELALERSNLQVLCWPCNRRKAATLI